MSKTTTRRALVAGAAMLPIAASVAVIPAPAAADSAHPDAALLDLGRQLTEAWREERALTDESPEAEHEIDAAYEKCSAIVKKIEPLSASSIEGLRVKSLAILWCHDGDTDLWDCYSTDMRLAKSIVRDLLP